MKGALALAVLLATAEARAGAACPAEELGAGPGVADPFHIPSAAAKQLNADALAFYRQGKWEEARQKYRAAEVADPQFLAPALNVACSFVRQERFADAVAEVKRLLDTAYLPWSEELATAADLGALKVRPEGRVLRAILDEDRKKWSEGLSDDVLFVARTRAPLKLGNDGGGPVGGTFVLGPHQEVFAWSPRTRRYRQLTSEQGRVLLLGRSRDGHRISYLTAEKLVVTPPNQQGLRGLTIKEVDLGTLAVLDQARAGQDVGSVSILQAGPSGFIYEIGPPGQITSKGASFAIHEGELQPSSSPRNAKRVARLKGQSGEATGREPIAIPGCRATVADVSAPANGGPPAVEIRQPGRVPFAISGPFGGGLSGIP